MKLKLSERSTRLIRELERVAAECIDQSDVSRTTLAREFDVSRNTLGTNLKSGREAGETTDPRWAFAVLEFFGRDPVQVLEGLCPPCLPEELLSVLPVPEPAEKPSRRTRAYRRRVAFLRAARETADLVEADPEGLLSKPWPVRRQSDSSLRRVYEELEKLDLRRRQEGDIVEAECQRGITSEIPEAASIEELVRRIGIIGVWGAIQRSKCRLRFAKDALSLSLAAARKLGDWSLLSDQLRRSAWVFQDLDVPKLAVQALREASEICRADRNQDGDAYAMISRASIAAIHGEMKLAHGLYLTGLKSLTPSSSPVYRVMATQGLAICREHEGNIEGALACLSAAVSGEENTALGKRFRASLLLTAGNLLRKLMRLAEAERNYREALLLLEGEPDPESKIKVYVDLAICLAKSGKEEEVHKVAIEVQAILPEIPNQSFLQTQAELLCRELASEFVNVEALGRIQTALNKRSHGGSNRRVQIVNRQVPE